ncbi:MAG: divergent PAP2 family protein [Symbiobacteriia bacterium]
MAFIGAYRYLLVPLIALGTSMIFKAIGNRFKLGHFYWRRVGYGGFPSSHTTLVTTVTFMIGIDQGFRSPLFALAAFVDGVVISDAAVVRRAAGKQAEALNRIILELRKTHTIKEEQLRELLGHTPYEIIGGFILGVLAAVVGHAWLG